MRRLSVISARLEAYLSTHAFNILFLVLYLLSNFITFIWGAHGEFHHIRKTYELINPSHTGFKWFIAIARGAGYALNLNCAIIIILACRVILTQLRESFLQQVLPLDKAFPLAHICVAYGIVVSLLIHIPFHLVWLIRYNMWDGFKMWSYTWTVVMGIALLLVFITMFVFALPSVREKYFHIFYLVHLIGATLFFALVILHGMYRKVPETYKWVTPGLALYIIDRICRRLQMKKGMINLEGKHATVLSGNVVKLQFPKPFDYRAGQYAEICIPSIGKTKEWHPFTIASSPMESNMVFYIKKSGDWTSRLHAKAKNGESFKAQIRGPFGAPAQHAHSFRRVVLISGGIGSTPFTAICKDLYHRNQHSSSSYAKTASMKCGVDDHHIDSKLNATLANAINSLYNLEGSDTEQVNQLANYTADAIKLATPYEIDELSDSQEDSIGSISTERDIEKGELHVRSTVLSKANTYRASLTSFLHSTRVVLFLLLTIATRIALVCVSAIIQQTNYWVGLADALLSIFLTITVGVAIGLEVSYLKLGYFKQFGCIADSLVFWPLSVLATYFSFSALQNTDKFDTGSVLKNCAILPVLLILLAYRMYRSLSSRKLHYCKESNRYSKDEMNAPDVDFVWCTSTNKEDEWLQKDLEVLSSGTALRLHRYVTREEPEQLSTEKDTEIRMIQGRPHWVSLFSRIAQKTASHSDVGVFFCGPPRMGNDVKKALRSVEAFCNVRGAYLNALTDGQIAQDLKIIDHEVIKLLRQFGSNVRFLFREENF